MIIDKKEHSQLLENELIFRTSEFEKILKKPAAKLFMEGQLYLGRFLGMDKERGNLLVKFDHTICLPPRRNETLQCFIPVMQDANVRNWGAKTYQELRNDIRSQFESKTVFHDYKNSETIVGFSGVGVNTDMEVFRDSIVFLGPQDPPLNYLLNLINYVKSERAGLSLFTENDLSLRTWAPQILLSANDSVQTILHLLETEETIVIQGPPGTGKTYLTAQICNALLCSDKKIFVTASTNRSLIELAEKDKLQNAIAAGQVFKASMSTDESKNKKIRGLVPFRSLSQQAPNLLLATYYVMSQLSQIAGSYFDLVIIEEASQAFLSTIAMAKKMGKKCLIIGDTQQLKPIFHQEYSLLQSPERFYMVNGLKAVSVLSRAAQLILTDSYRLSPASAEATSNFYPVKLSSKSRIPFPLNYSEDSSLASVLDVNGGCSFLDFDAGQGKLPSEAVCGFIVGCIAELMNFKPKCEIAILTFHRTAVRFLQKELYSRVQDKANLLVDTIDRIQGLTVDYCIVVIPVESIPFVMETNRFNVMTSRAAQGTLLIGERSVNEGGQIPVEIKRFLAQAKWASLH